jgi:HNH endonuclease/NUMOD4 motif
MAASTYDEASNEIWRPIPEFPGYEASNLGRIRSFRGRSCIIMSQADTGNGYLSVKLRVDNKYVHIKVHRAVLMAHVGYPKDGHVAAHLDANRKNNSLTNLRWCSRHENERDKIFHGTSNHGSRNGKAVLDEFAVSAIRAANPRCPEDYRMLGSKYGVKPHTVYLAATRRAWSHVG